MISAALAIDLLQRVRAARELTRFVERLGSVVPIELLALARGAGLGCAVGGSAMQEVAAMAPVEHRAC
jgi:hypothetical protein